MTKGDLPVPSPRATGLWCLHTRESCDSQSEHSKPGPWDRCRGRDWKQHETSPSPAQWPSQGRGCPAAPGHLPCHAEKAKHTEKPARRHSKDSPAQTEPDRQTDRRDSQARVQPGLKRRSTQLPGSWRKPSPDFAFLLLTTKALTSAQACAHVCTRASAAGCLCTRAPAAWAGHASPHVFAPKLCQGPWPGPTPAFCLGMGSCLSHPPRAGPASSLCSRGPPTPRADQP